MQGAPSLTNVHVANRMIFAEFIQNNMEIRLDADGNRQLYICNKTVIFSDESHFNLKDPTLGGKKVWRHGSKGKPEAMETTQSQSAYVSFGGAVSCNKKFKMIPLHYPKMGKNGQPILHKSGTPKYQNASIGSKDYIKLVLEPLKLQLIEAGMLVDNKLVGCIWMQDGASSHTCNATMIWLRDNFGLENCITKASKDYQDDCLAMWPPHSPDLNPLDMSLWHFLKTLVFRHQKNGTFFSREECISVTISEWENTVTLEDIRNVCVEGFVNKIKQTIEAAGHTTKNAKKIVDPIDVDPLE